MLANADGTPVFSDLTIILTIAGYLFDALEFNQIGKMKK